MTESVSNVDVQPPSERRKPTIATTEVAQIAASASLAEQRSSRGISLETIAEATKISIQFLRAIEAEDFRKLPGGIYDTNYIRQYAAFIGLDEVGVLARYMKSIDSAQLAYQPPEIAESRFQHALRCLLNRFGN